MARGPRVRVMPDMEPTEAQDGDTREDGPMVPPHGPDTLPEPLAGSSMASDEDSVSSVQINPPETAPTHSRLLLYAEDGAFVVGHRLQGKGYDIGTRQWVRADAFKLWPADLPVPFDVVGWLYAPEGVF